MKPIAYKDLVVGRKYRIEPKPGKTKVADGGVFIATKVDGDWFHGQRVGGCNCSLTLSRYDFYPAEEPAANLCDSCANPQCVRPHNAQGLYECVSYKPADIPVTEMADDGSTYEIVKWGILFHAKCEIQRRGDEIWCMGDHPEHWASMHISDGVFQRHPDDYRVRITKKAEKPQKFVDPVSLLSESQCKTIRDRVRKTFQKKEKPKMKKLRAIYRLWKWTGQVVWAGITIYFIKPWAVLAYETVRPLATKLLVSLWAWTGLPVWGEMSEGAHIAIIVVAGLCCVLLFSVMMTSLTHRENGKRTFRPLRWAWKKLTE